MDEVKTPGKLEEAGNDDSHHTVVHCQLCLKKSGRYTCPRCNVQYCSVTCYKSEAHANCSEEFYKNCFLEGLNEQHASSEDRNKMLEMLMRLESEQPAELDSDDDDVLSLEERLAGLDLDKDSDLDQVWENLTTSERSEFQTMIQDGSFRNLITPWEPWWTHKKNDLIEEVGEESRHQISLPAIISDVPPLSKLLNGKKPSDKIKFSVLNTLYSYAYVVRIYNGDHHGNQAQNAAQEILNLCGGVRNAVFLSTSEALQGCLQALHQSTETACNHAGVSLAVLCDVIRLIEGPDKRNPDTYVQAALSDLHGLIRNAKHSLDKEIKTGKSTEEDKKEATGQKRRLFSAQKKAHFFISWVQAEYRSLLPLVPEIEDEFCALSTELTVHTETKQKFERHWGGQVPKKSAKLIQEIS